MEAFNAGCDVAAANEMNGADYIARQESGIYEECSDYSDMSFSEPSCDDGEDDSDWESGGDDWDETSCQLWEELQHCSYWSPTQCLENKSTCQSRPVKSCEDKMQQPLRQSKVTFKPADGLVQVYYIDGDECRKGHWEQFAVDRQRFAERIEQVGRVLQPCLQKQLSHHNQ